MIWWPRRRGDSVDIKTIAAVVGPVVALCSLVVNIYLFNRSQSKTAPAIRKQEIRDTLKALIAKLNSSQVVSIQPHYEHWLYGFDSMEELRSLCAAAHVVISNSSLPPQNVKTIVADMLTRIRAVLTFRDSLNHLKADRQYLSPDDYEKWPQKREAEISLNDFQNFVRNAEPQLASYLASL